MSSELDEPSGWHEKLLVDLLNRLEGHPGAEHVEWFDDAWPEPYFEFHDLGLVEGIEYSFEDDGSSWIEVDVEASLTDKGRRVAEAARRRLAAEPFGMLISSLPEDSAVVDQLCASLEGAGVRTWRGIHQLLPADEWKNTVSKAIDGGIGFIACFSNRYEEHPSSYMTEELELAVEQLRLRPDDSDWFMPVLLDDVQPPDIAIGPGRTLRDLPSIWWHRNPTHARNAVLRAIDCL